MENELKRASITKQLTKIILVLGLYLSVHFCGISSFFYFKERKGEKYRTDNFRIWSVIPWN